MSTLTKEWLQQAINDYESVRDELPFGLDDYQVNILAALRIALASLEAEPVAWISERNLKNLGKSYSVYVKHEPVMVRPIPLYTAPPAPVSVHDESAIFEAAIDICRKSDAIDEHAWNHGVLAVMSAFRACRAAMLHAGNHTEQHLDMVNSPVIPDGWQLVPKEPTEAMNKAGWAAINEHDAINPTYRAMLAAAPQQEVK